ncbi:unnamed protein product, partial [Prorocentrum cordatum]
KGWKRTLALYFVFHAVKTSDTLASLKENFADTQLADFGNVYAIVPDAKSDIDRIDTNLTASLVAAASRERPNCFKWLHQVHKKLLLGASEKDVINLWKDAKEVKTVYGIGQGEATAVVNLCRGIPKEATDVLKNAAAKWGVVKGPVTHAGIGCPAITEGWGPDMNTADLSNEFKNTAHTVLLMAKKAVKVFEDAPAPLRKPKGHKEIVELQLLCRGFEVSMNKVKQRLPEPVYNANVDMMYEKFMAGFMDASLPPAVDNALTDLDICLIPEFRSLIAGVEDEERRKNLEKSEELNAKLQQASLENLLQRLAVDKQALMKYYAEVAKDINSFSDREAARKKKLSKTGMDAVSARMTTHCYIVDTSQVKSNELVGTMTAEYSSWKHDVASLATQMSDTSPSVWTLVVLDFSIAPPMEDMDSYIQVCASILHQDSLNAAFVLFPKTHKALDVARQLSLVRRIEDKLLGAAVDIEREVDVHYSVQDEHGNDARPHNHRARLCVSSRVGTKSPWCRGKLSRGALNLELIRVKDMTVFKEVGFGDPSRELGPGDRLLQKGPAACKGILAMTSAENLPTCTRNDKLLVVDMCPAISNQWASAIMDSQLEWLQQPDITLPMPFYLGMNRTSKEISAKLKADSAAKMLRDWWSTQERLIMRHGMRWPTFVRVCVNALGHLGQESGQVALASKPTLEILVWNCSDASKGGDDYGVKLRDVHHVAFDDSTSCKDTWDAQSRSVLDELNCLAPRASTGAGPNVTHIQPDYTDSPPPVIETKTLKVLDDFNEEEVLFKSRPLVDKPIIYVMKDFRIVLKVCPQTSGNSAMQLRPFEMFGFGAGDFVVEKWDVLAKDVNNHLQFKIDDDTSWIIWGLEADEAGALDEVKTPTLLCEAVATALEKKSLDNVGLQFYKLTPKTNTDGTTEVRLRYTVTSHIQSTAFIPTPMSDALLVKKDQKAAQLGSAFLGKFGLLPNNDCRILWDCTLDEANPAQFKPIKPKCWFVKNTSLDASTYYVLE